MFGFFKKKEEKPQEKGDKRPTEAPENKQFKEFAAQYQPEELTILAVTGAESFGQSRDGRDELWTASTELTAWMEEDSPDIHRGSFTLTTVGDDKLLLHLRMRVRPDNIIKFQGRVSQDGQRLLLLNLPEPGFDPDLKAILEEQKKPVTFQEEGLGTFTFNRRINWFETEVDWLGKQTALVFDAKQSREKCVQTAKSLLASAAEWDGRVREYAAGELLELANEWAEDEEEITKEQFIAWMEPESIEVESDGTFRFTFTGDGLFCGNSFSVYCGLACGPLQADVDD